MDALPEMKINVMMTVSNFFIDSICCCFPVRLLAASVAWPIYSAFPFFCFFLAHFCRCSWGGGNSALDMRPRSMLEKRADINYILRMIINSHFLSLFLYLFFIFYFLPGKLQQCKRFGKNTKIAWQAGRYAQLIHLSHCQVKISINSWYFEAVIINVNSKQAKVCEH